MPKKSIQKQFVKPWKKISENWELLSPPARPSKKNILDYEELLLPAIQGVRNPKILVLGATPEIRDFLSKLKNVEVTICDINIEMILAMTKLLKNKKTPVQEIWLKSNWQNMPLKKNYYHGILGDYVLGNFPLKKYSQLFIKLNSLLVKRGYFITRIFFYDSSTVEDFNKVADKYKNQKVTHQTITDFWMEGYFLGPFEKNGIISTKKFKARMDKYVKNNPKIKPLFNKLDQFLSPYEKDYNFYNLKETEKMFRKYFIIKNKLPEIGTTLSQNTYLYQLSPKR